MAIHGLFIGIDRYASSHIRWLDCARRDALALHALISDTLGSGSVLLTDGMATRDAIQQECAKLETVDKDDIVFLFYSGHGSDTHELVTFDADGSKLATTAIPLDLLTEWFMRIPAKRLICILDCCFSGGMGAKVLASDWKPKDISTVDTKLDRLAGSGRLILTASSAMEPAWENQRLGHGLLTHYLLEAMQGAPEVQQAGRLPIYQLLHYVTKRVTDAAASLGRSQHPALSIKRRGTQGVGVCPLPGHPKGGNRSLSFSVSFPKRIFQCFGCQAKGNVIDFIAYMEGLNPRDPQQFRKAAVMAQERFGSAAMPTKPQTPAKSPPLPPSSTPSVLVNEPLDFALKNLDIRPQYLLNRGFTPETIDHFGLGYCTKGTFAGRIVIPLHDLQSRLIGYAGRIVFDDAIDAQNPKYLFPSRRQREGKTLEFSKALFIYHGHALIAHVEDLVIVQGFPACWWLWQHGYENVVALMGATCSTDQANAIVGLSRPNTRIPVVSTPSVGGRDVWYDSYNSLVVEPTQDAVTAAVKHFQNHPPNAARIREDYLSRANMFRKRFQEDVLGSILKHFGIRSDPAQVMRKCPFRWWPTQPPIPGAMP